VQNTTFSDHVLKRYDWVLDHFDGEQISRGPGKCDVLCPNPDHPDTRPSLGVDVATKNGSVPMILMNCRSGPSCSNTEILSEVGLKERDLYFNNYARANGLHVIENGTRIVTASAAQSDNSRGDTGCTVAMYTEAKGLPESFLTGPEVGLFDRQWRGVPAVWIPYVDEAGEHLVYRYRVSLNGDKRVVSKAGEPTVLYGLNRLDDCREAGFVLVAEGESDAHSCWHRGWPCLAVPGSGSWKPEWDSYLDGIPDLLVHIEPDVGGQQLWERLSAREALAGRLKRVELS
jgi:hypothetical protein